MFGGRGTLDVERDRRLTAVHHGDLHLAIYLLQVLRFTRSTHDAEIHRNEAHRSRSGCWSNRVVPQREKKTEFLSTTSLASKTGTLVGESAAGGVSLKGKEQKRASVLPSPGGVPFLDHAVDQRHRDLHLHVRVVRRRRTEVVAVNRDVRAALHRA